MPGLARALPLCSLAPAVLAGCIAGTIGDGDVLPPQEPLGDGDAGQGVPDVDDPGRRDGGPTSMPDGGPAPGDPDAGPPPTGSVPAFIAQGLKGRMVMSCDDGRTWPIDSSLDDDAECFGRDGDCDHGPGSGQGLAYGDGLWMRTFGWGPPGAVARSQDGVVWEDVTTETTFAGVVFGDRRWVLGNRRPSWSDDDGLTWTEVGENAVEVYNARRTGFGRFGGGGRFLMYASTRPNREMAISEDGKTWWNPDTFPDACEQAQTAPFATGNGVFLTFGGFGRDSVCRSDDGGRTWSVVRLPGSGTSQVFWNGTEFRIYRSGSVFRSQDGLRWETDDVTPDIEIGAIAISDEGTYASVTTAWGVWYESQRWYRSEDGLDWEVLPESAARRGHPIRFMEFGYVQASNDGCPGR